MYSLVLATMLTTGQATPAWGSCHGCHGCHGCWGSHACWGCHGCHGCSGGWGNTYGGCLGSGGYAIAGCFGCSGGCYGYGYGYGAAGSWYGCWGCNGSGGFGSCYGSYGACYGSGGYGGACYGNAGYGSAASSGYFGSAGYGSAASSGYFGGAQEYVVPGSMQYDSSPAPVTPATPERVRPPEKKTYRDAAPGSVYVRLPAGAKLFVDGQPVAADPGSGPLWTPKLEPGQDYFYTFRAEAVQDGRVVSRQARVIVRAGEEARVDFSDLKLAAKEEPPVPLTAQVP
jgi:uncharacterized protein (TIGR03000 family)